jgi:glyoxylase-like metal-dependent hydrolase (beta-lactamase superfamily II)
MERFKDFELIEVSGAYGGDCYLLRSDERALCDTGFSFAAETMCDRLAAALGEDSLTYILLTHAHYDHAGGAMRAKAAHPRARLVCSRVTAEIFARPGAVRLMRELDAVAAGEQAGGETPAGCPTATPPREAGGLPTFRRASQGDLLDTFAADIIFDAEAHAEAYAGGHSADIGPGVTAIASPGHTRDSTCYYFSRLGLLVATETTGVPWNSEIIPTFITIYRQALAAAEKIREIAPAYILSPHHGLLEGEEARAFPQKSREASERFADFVMKRHRAGLSYEQIIADYLDEYYYRVLKPMGKQPLAAALANAEAMIPRVIAELSE